MFFQKVSLALIAGWLLNQTLCERHRRYSYVLPPPTSSSREILTYEPYQAGYGDNSIEPFTERQAFDEDEEEVPPSPYSPPPMDDSAAEDFGESETEAPPTTTAEPTTTEPTTTRESIRKKRKQLKRKLSALTRTKFRDKIQRRSSGKSRKKVTYVDSAESAESHAARQLRNVPGTPTINDPSVPTLVGPAAHFASQNQAHVPHMPPPVRGPLSLPPVTSHSHTAMIHDQLHGPPSLVSSQNLKGSPLVLPQVHTTPAPASLTLPVPHNLPHSLVVPPLPFSNRSPASVLLPATSLGSVSLRNHHPSAFITPQGPSSVIADYHQPPFHGAQQLFQSPIFHSQYGASHPMAFHWAQPIPIINLTQHPATTASPGRRPTKYPIIKPTEGIKSYFRKRSSYPRSNDGIIKGHAHDHISFKKTFHMTLFKIPFLSIDVAKKVYKDESLIADLGKRTGESYNHAHG